MFPRVFLGTFDCILTALLGRVRSVRLSKTGLAPPEHLQPPKTSNEVL